VCSLWIRGVAGGLWTWRSGHVLFARGSLGLSGCLAVSDGLPSRSSTAGSSARARRRDRAACVATPRTRPSATTWPTPPTRRPAPPSWSSRPPLSSARTCTASANASTTSTTGSPAAETGSPCCATGSTSPARSRPGIRACAPARTRRSSPALDGRVRHPPDLAAAWFFDPGFADEVRRSAKRE
jgi:hypothetical protein